MKIKVAVIENSPRRNGEAVINGFDVQVLDANLVGSEKQIEWAERIIAEAVRTVAGQVVGKVGDIVQADAVDASVAQVNTRLAVMSKLAGSKAADWIDHRHLGAGVVAHMMAAV